MTIKTDAVVIGAGPCGLFQVFELGLLGLKAHVVDSMPVVGGQCAELYPDKPIYDIPAVVVCSGEELVQQLMLQIKPFKPEFHLDQEVTELAGNGDGPFRVVSSAGTEFEAGVVIIAGGVGSFQPRRLRVPGADALDGRSIHYRVQNPQDLHGKRLVVLGAGDSALDWTLELLPHAKALTQIHRSDQFRAAPASVDKMRAAAAAGEMRLIEGAQVSAIEADGDSLRAISVRMSDKSEQRLEVDALLVFFGLAPKLGPIADWGLDLNRKTINVDTEKFQTNIPGIFAIGDINHYPGKKKLILSGFHEAALAAFAAKHHLQPDQKVHLQYTTTSPIMHERLGVKDPE